MVTILDPKEGMRKSERNVQRALGIAPSADKELRHLAGQYKSALIGKHKSRHVGILQEDHRRPTSNEAHMYQYGYGRGYEAATAHILTLLFGEEGYGMFKAWAEPLEGEV